VGQLTGERSGSPAVTFIQVGPRDSLLSYPIGRLIAPEFFKGQPGDRTRTVARRTSQNAPYPPGHSATSARCVAALSLRSETLTFSFFPKFPLAPLWILLRFILFPRPPHRLQTRST
jgi:hypothetical protein